MNLTIEQRDILLRALNLTQFENDNLVYLYENDPCMQEAVRVAQEETELIKVLRRKIWEYPHEPNRRGFLAKKEISCYP